MSRSSFTSRLMLFAVALIALSVFVSSIFIHRLKIQDLTADLSRELLGIVNTAALSIDSAGHERIRLNADGEVADPEAFKALQAQLVAIKEANRLQSSGSPIYTMRAVAGYETNGLVEFVGMTDPDESGQVPVGNVYEATPSLRRALQGTPSVTGVYSDMHGEWISAAAPIRDPTTGRVVGAIQADRTAAYFKSAARQEVLRVIQGSLATLVIAALTAVLFARRLVRPLQLLAKAARHVGQGNFSWQSGVSRSDEIGDLARCLDEAAHSLEERRRREQALSDELKQTNGVLELSLQNATELAHAAQAADRAKSDFLATMSHELRTPLNHIIGLSEVMLMTPLSADQSDSMATIRSSGQDLLRLVEGVLDFGMIEARRLRLDHAPFSLRKLSSELEAEARSKIGSKPIRLQFEVSAQAADEFIGDRRRLYQVLRHLVDNAIKFTEKGEVTVRMCPMGEDSAEPSLTFRVSDTGPGIAIEDQVRILRPFSQVDSSRTRQHGGIGMGLILSDRLVQLMGGQLDLSSEPGRGTTVQFHLKPSPGSCATAAA